MKNILDKINENILSSNGAGIGKLLNSLFNASEGLEFKVVGNKITGWKSKRHDFTKDSAPWYKVQLQDKKIADIPTILANFYKNCDEVLQITINQNTDLKDLDKLAKICNVEIQVDRGSWDSQQIISVVKEINKSDVFVRFEYNTINGDLDMSSYNTTTLNFYGCDFNNAVTVNDNFKLSTNQYNSSVVFNNCKFLESFHIKNNSSKLILKDMVLGYKKAKSFIRNLKIDEGIKGNISATDTSILNFDDFVSRKKELGITDAEIKKQSKNPAAWLNAAGKDPGSGPSLPDMFGNPIHVGDIIGWATGTTSKGFHSGGKTDVHVEFEPVVGVSTKRIQTNSHPSIKPETVFRIDKEDLKKYDKLGKYKSLY